jgi:hypothetical protein
VNDEQSLERRTARSKGIKQRGEKWKKILKCGIL